jgi:hypothetical protein
MSEVHLESYGNWFPEEDKRRLMGLANTSELPEDNQRPILQFHKGSTSSKVTPRDIEGKGFSGSFERFLLDRLRKDT